MIQLPTPIFFFLPFPAGCVRICYCNMVWMLLDRYRSFLVYVHLWLHMILLLLLGTFELKPCSKILLLYGSHFVAYSLGVFSSVSRSFNDPSSSFLLAYDGFDSRLVLLFMMVKLC
jgi:hypothetical protein